MKILLRSQGGPNELLARRLLAPNSLARVKSVFAIQESKLNGSFLRQSYFAELVSEMKNDWMIVVVVLGLCAVVGGCGSGSNISTGGGGGGSPVVSLVPKVLTFDVQAVGTTSPPETVTLANQGNAALTIKSIDASGDFAQTNNCGATLSAGANCIINVVFSPTGNGNRTGSVTLTDNASDSPQSVTLGGAGTSSGNGQNCALLPGTTSQDQTQEDVTSQLSFVNTTAGVTVTQLTNNGCNRFYYFDVPAYSAAVNRILYVNFVTGSGNQVLTAKPDGTDAKIISVSRTGNQSFVSPDGTLAYYDKPVLTGIPNGSDIFGGILNGNPFQELQITKLDLAPQKPLPVWEISTSSPDPAGGQDIAFSPDILLHLVHVKTDGTSQPPQIITLDDPESTATFHRLRLNPKFPNIVMYKRNNLAGSGATPELWLVDLNTCAGGTCSASNIVNVVQNLGGPGGQTGKAGHIIWSPDGLDIAFSEPDIADFWIARGVVKSDGTLNLTNGGIPRSALQELGPFTSPQTTANYCVFPPDWPNSTVLACVSGPASFLHPTTFYLLSSDGKGTMKLLAASDALVLTVTGTPLPRFAQDNTHLLFNSDRPTASVPTGSVQVYVISGFTLAVP